MAIKQAEETNKCAAAWKFCVMGQNVWNVWCWRKHNELLIKVANSTKKAFHMPRQGNLNPSHKKKVVEFVQ